MPKDNPSLESHEHLYIKTNFNPLISICTVCSSVCLLTESQLFKSIKPNQFDIKYNEEPLYIFTQMKPQVLNFKNQKEYLEIRTQIIKEMKQICHQHSLQYKTFFAAVYYLDKISSQLFSFRYDSIRIISIFCIILSCKYWENGEIGCIVEDTYKRTISMNYANDELFVLKLLDYDLSVSTSYDYLMSMIQIGFVFDNESFDKKKLTFIYSHIEKMLYAFVERRSYLELDQLTIALGLIGFLRDNLDLLSLPEHLIKLFGNDVSINYNEVVEKVKKCVKIKKVNKDVIVRKKIIEGSKVKM